MNTFLISVQDDYKEDAAMLVKKHFGEHNMRLKDRTSPLWVIATEDDKTSAKISEMMNMTGDVETDKRVHGMVVRLYEYYGHDYLELWQQLEMWSRKRMSPNE